MKRFAILLCAIVGTCGYACAQDLLVKRNGEQIKVKVTEISDTSIKYKRFSNIDGPTYVVPQSEVQYIEYVNGERDTFAPQPAVQPTPPTVSAPTPTQAVRYSIGDVYDRNGVRGMVWTVTDEGIHGTIISFDEECLAWSVKPRKESIKVGADSKYDGAANMQAVAAYIASGAASWDDFPAFKWCRELGEGWFLPSINELWTFGNVYCGGSREQFKRNVRSAYNTTLKANGKAINNIMYYFSSTETDAADAQFSHMGTEKPYVQDTRKTDALYVRAFHKF